MIPRLTELSSSKLSGGIGNAVKIRVKSDGGPVRMDPNFTSNDNRQYNSLLTDIFNKVRFFLVLHFQHLFVFFVLPSQTILVAFVKDS